MSTARKKRVIFNPYNEIGIENDVRLVIYDEKEKDIFRLIEIKTKEEYELNELELEGHLRYLYKYQIKKDDGWIDKVGYKNIRFEKISEDGIKYLLYPHRESDFLIVGFQGISKSPGYNYVRTLKDAQAIQLYIKDDYGEGITKSSYYLGANWDFNIAENTLDLIEEIRISQGVKKENVICIGSSKGGYASLYFAYKAGYGHVVIGGPQTKLGTYLSKGRKADNPDLDSFMPKILEYLVGTVTDEKIMKADEILYDVIKNSGNDPSVFIHVGKGEPHYKNHVVPFIEFADKLKLKNIAIDLGDYDKHNELPKHFPKLLKEKVLEIISESSAIVLK